MKKSTYHFFHYSSILIIQEPSRKQKGNRERKNEDEIPSKERTSDTTY